MTSKGYWKRRALILEQLVRDKADATVGQIARIYDAALENITGQINKVFDTYAQGGALSEKQAMALLSVKQTAEYRAELQALYAAATDSDIKRELLARLNAPAYANRISCLQALRDRVYAEARMTGLTEVSYVRDRLQDVLEFAYYRQTFDLQQGTGACYDFGILTDNQVRAALAMEWSGENWSARLWDNNQAFADAVQEAVTVGILAGLRYDEMRDNLLAAVGLDATGGAKYRAARLVRTECAYIANQGHLLGYRAAGLDTYVFLATLDLRTSEICRSLDMKRFPVAEAQAGVNLPPMHPNCRSTTMGGLTDEDIASLQRAARDPVTGKYMTVPGNMTYPEWYAKYVAGNPEALAREKAAQNKAADRKQFARYKAILGGDGPNSLAEFQNIKYSDSEKWADLHTSYLDRTLQARIRSGEYDLTVNPEKQARHLLDSDEYISGRSYLNISKDDPDAVQAFVSQYAGTGELIRDVHGDWKNQELVQASAPIGCNVSRIDGAETETDRAIIHYSKSGTHVVPTQRKFSWEVQADDGGTSV